MRYAHTNVEAKERAVLAWVPVPPTSDRTSDVEPDSESALKRMKSGRIGIGGMGEWLKPPRRMKEGSTGRAPSVTGGLEIRFRLAAQIAQI